MLRKKDIKLDPLIKLIDGDNRLIILLFFDLLYLNNVVFYKPMLIKVMFPKV